MQSMTVARGLRLPSYLILAMTAIQPIVDLALRSAPMRIHSPAWRLALVANGTTAAGTVLLILLLILLIAVAVEDRGVAYAVSSFSAACAGLCVIAAGAFALDALQVKGQSGALDDRYDAGSIWVVVRLAIAALLFVLLAVNAMRSAKATRFVPPPAAPKRSAVLINTPPRAGAAPPVVTTPPRSHGKPVDS